ncbi:MAG: MBL fold metallo-hydrolase [Ilumatobacteraceae bacterium]
MRIRFWGTRGSIATPGPSTVRYGGNTACVELRSASGTLLVFDCGTGARLLGQALVEESRANSDPATGSILLGHTHWDHIQGLPFFEPLFGSDRWDVYGPRGLGGSLDQTLAGQMNYQYFPVALDQLAAGVEYHELVEGVFEIGDLVVRTQYLNHPALTLGFRVECDGAVVCYVSDHEPFDPELGAGGDVLANEGDAHHVEFLQGADIVIHDAQYSAAEYIARVGWGHSTVEYVVDVACAAGVKQTVLYHHDPSHDDDTIDRLVEQANAQAKGRTQVVAAAEGNVLEVASTSPPTSPNKPPSAAASPALDDLSASIVIISGDQALREAVEAAAHAEHWPVVDANDTAAAAENAARVVVVADTDDAAGRLDRLQSAIAPSAWTHLGILAVTRAPSSAPPAPAGVADWLVWPATAAHVRTKLRAAVLRRACRWVAAPLPPDEETRLDALLALDILDTDAEDRFDHFTEAACKRFSVPIALITLVDRERQWFKSRHGVDFTQSPRDESFCAHTILGPDVMQVPDVLRDPRFADSPAAIGPARVRFYAGAPLILDDGSRVGTLCIADHRPRLLDHGEIDALRHLADEVVTELQDRTP